MSQIIWVLIISTAGFFGADTVTITFATEAECEQASNTVTYNGYSGKGLRSTNIRCEPRKK